LLLVVMSAPVMRIPLLLLLLGAPLAAAQPLDWEHAFGPYAGSPIAHDLGGGLVLVTSWSSSAVWRSADSGRSWTLAEGAFDRHDPPEVFVRLSAVVLYGEGNDEAYRSEDRGFTWTVIPLEGRRSAGALLVLPDRLYALTPLEAYVSYDGGVTWARIASTPMERPRDLVVAPDGALVARDERRMPEGGVYASRDGGQTWELLDDGLGEGVPDALAATPTALYVVMGGDPSRLYRMPFSPPSVPGPWEYVRLFGVSPEPPSLDVAAGDGTGDILYIGNSTTVYESVDGGATWTTSPEFIQPVVSVAALEGGILAGVDEGGLWGRRAPPGDPAPWALVGVPDCAIRNFEVPPTDGGERLITACAGFGFYGSSDSGRTWPLLGSPGQADIFWARVGATAAGSLFVNEARSLDGGRTWEDVLDVVPTAFVRGVDGAFHVASEFAWYTTTDEGSTWTTEPLFTWALDAVALPSGRIVLSGATVCPACSPVYLSDDGGLTWQPATEPPQYGLGALAVGDDGVVYGTEGYWDNEEHHDVWRSSDGGDHWVRTLEGDHYPMSDPPALWAGPPGAVVVARGREVFYSWDWGETWTSGGEVLPEQPVDIYVTDLHVTPDRWVLAATGGRGVYRALLPRPTATEGEPPPRPSALTVWPNPASTSLTVSAPRGVERLDLFDALGRAVLSVPMPAGGGRTEVGVSTLPRGVYFVRAGAEVVLVTVLK
jgi:photosystem II stability/assembly factor-like uncharacterized protein